MLISISLIPILAILLIFKFDRIKGLIKSDTFHVVKNFIVFKIRGKLLEWLGVGIAVNRNNTFKVNYYANDLLYTIVVKKNRLRRITHIARISDADTSEVTDITHDLRHFMGPYGNFHGIPTTPKMLGLSHGVTVSYKNAEKVDYKIDDVIKVE